MKRLLIRVAVLLGGMFLISCIAASIVTRFVYVDRLEPQHIAMYLGGCIILATLLALLTPRKKPQPEPEPQPEEEPEPPLSLRERYYTQYERIAPPENTYTGQAVTFLFGPYAILLDHIIWERDGILMLFPTFEATETAFERMQPLDVERIPLEPLCIPVSAILYFSREVGDDDGFTLLRYQDALGQATGITLGENAADALKKILPRADLQRFRERTYPRSTRQISDIRQQLQALKELWDQSLIGEQEYAEKKLDLIAKL